MKLILLSALFLGSMCMCYASAPDLLNNTGSHDKKSGGHIDPTDSYTLYSRHINSMVEEGRQEGERRAAEASALSMLAAGWQDALIIKYTGLSEKQLENLKR